MTNAQHNWEQFALLLIDVQRDFWSEQAAKVYPDFPANIATLLTLCRNEDIEVVHLRASFKADMSDWMPKYMLRGGIPRIQGTAGEEPVPFAVENPGETVILKHTFDGFHNSELLQYLRALLNESAFAPRNPYSKAVCQSSVGQVACKTAKVQLQVGAKLFMQQSPPDAKNIIPTYLP
jgi:isochorismate hydrolase